MPVRLATPALERFGKSETVKALGGPKLLNDVRKLLTTGSINTASDLCSKVYMAVASASSKLSGRARAQMLEEAGREFRLLVEALANPLAPIGWRLVTEYYLPNQKYVKPEKKGKKEPIATLLAPLREAHPSWLWLRSSTVLFRGLPEAATAADLAKACEWASEESAAAAQQGTEEPVRHLDPVVHFGTDKTMAHVDLGSEGAAERLLKAAGKSAGLSLSFPAESQRWEMQVTAAQTAYDALNEELEKAKEAEAEADAALAAKKEAIGSPKKWKAFEKTAAGKELKEAKVSASNAFNKPSIKGEEPLTKRHADAKKALDIALAGRRAKTVSNGGEITVEQCGKSFGLEPRKRFASELLSESSSTTFQSSADKAEAVMKLNELKPYVDKLKIAESKGLDGDLVEQEGFKELFKLESGEATSATCPICYDAIGTNGAMVTTPCAHLFCRTCLLDWFAAQNVMMSIADLGRLEHAETVPVLPYTLLDQQAH